MHYLDKYVTMKQIAAHGVIAVIRGRTMEEGIKTADACISGGVKLIEFAFTTPQAVRAIELLVKNTNRMKMLSLVLVQCLKQHLHAWPFSRVRDSSFHRRLTKMSYVSATYIGWSAAPVL